jgi:hypothetical protein
MKMLIIKHARRKIGMDEDTRQALGVSHRGTVYIHGPEKTVGYPAYKTTLGAASLRAALNPALHVVFVSRTILDNLNVKSGDLVEVTLVSERPAKVVADTVKETKEEMASQTQAKPKPAKPTVSADSTVSLADRARAAARELGARGKQFSGADLKLALGTSFDVYPLTKSNFLVAVQRGVYKLGPAAK